MANNKLVAMTSLAGNSDGCCDNDDDDADDGAGDVDDGHEWRSLPLVHLVVLYYRV